MISYCNVWKQNAEERLVDATVRLKILGEVSPEPGVVLIMESFESYLYDALR